MNERSRIDRGWFSIVIRPLLSPLIIIIVINFFFKYFYRFGPLFIIRETLFIETTFVTDARNARSVFIRFALSDYAKR